MAIQTRRVSTIIIVSTALASISFGPFANAEDGFKSVASLTGVARVKDGDGVLFGKVEIRLQGIAAPEHASPAGKASTNNLKRLISDKLVRCELDGEVTSKRSGRRPNGICFLGNTDIGMHQVETGHAIDCYRFSGGRYIAAEKKAIAAGKHLGDEYKLPGYCKATK